jgi:hypothetical protein
MARVINQFSTDTPFPGQKLQMVNAWYDFQLVLKLEGLYQSYHETGGRVRSSDVREAAGYLEGGRRFNRGIPQDMTTMQRVFATYGKPQDTNVVLADVAGFVQTEVTRHGGVGFGQDVVFFLNSVAQSRQPFCG